MDRQTQIMNLTQRLQQASSRRDWPGLRSLDGELALQARAWSRVETWTVAEQLALDKLREIHRTVLEQCSAEVRTLHLALSRIGAQKGRWNAYAQSTNWEDSL